MTGLLHHRILLDGAAWECKPSIGMDWLMRRSHLPDTRDIRGWMPATVPGSAAHDAWQAGEIPNPYFGRNTHAGEWVRYSTPEGAEYVAVCVPAFSIDTVHRDA